MAGAGKWYEEKVGHVVWILDELGNYKKIRLEEGFNEEDLEYLIETGWKGNVSVYPSQMDCFRLLPEDRKDDFLKELQWQYETPRDLWGYNGFWADLEDSMAILCVELGYLPEGWMDIEGRPLNEFGEPCDPSKDPRVIRLKKRWGLI